MMNQLFAVSGAPGAGKTTVLDALAERGYVVVAESARAIIKERRAQGLSPRPEPLAFAKEILARDIDKYESADPNQITFFDRSLVDALGMLKAAGGLSEVELETHLQSYPHNPKAFVFDAWQAIYVQDAERDQSFVEAQAVAASVSRWYSMCGFEVIDVPFVAVDERVAFILSEVTEPR